jgi:zona occludens toxin
MASAIHHGPPGSFKSNAVVQRFGIQALREGRTVVTNIRGFDSLDRIKDVFFNDEFPPEARLIFIDTSTQIARDYFACWYKWIPFRAMVIIDEAQTIYPDRADFKLEHLDRVVIHPDFCTIEEMSELRPPDVFTAFDKQRHYEWDIFLTTTNIAKIKRDIRESSEWAYRHRSLSEVSRFFKGQWYEHQHDPENNGKTAANRLGKPKRYRADARIFNCYQSTATGEHTPSQAGTRLFDDSGIRIKLSIAGIAILFVIGLFIYKANRQKPPELSTLVNATNNTAVQAPVSIVSNSGANTAKADNFFTNPLSTVKVSAPSIPDLSDKWRIAGRLDNKKTGKSVVILADLSGHTHLIPLGICSEDIFKQLVCMFNHQKVTAYSGSSVKKDNHPVLTSSIAH